MSFLLLSYANHTNDNGYYNLIYSLEKYGYKGFYKIIGENEKWINFMTKIRGCLNYLLSIKYNQNKLLICIIDCYDVLICRNYKYIIDNYIYNYNNKIIFGKESMCFKNNSKLKKYFKYNSKLYNNHFLNAGFVLGYISELIFLLEYVLSLDIYDDQLGYCNFIEKYPDICYIDLKSEFVANCTIKDIFYIKNTNKRIYDNRSFRFPSVLHIPNKKGDFMLRMNYYGKRILDKEYIGEDSLKLIRNSSNIYVILIKIIIIIIFIFTNYKIYKK